jgi:hypothetical protein
MRRSATIDGPRRPTQTAARNAAEPALGAPAGMRAVPRGRQLGVPVPRGTAAGSSAALRWRGLREAIGLGCGSRCGAPQRNL